MAGQAKDRFAPLDGFIRKCVAVGRFPAGMAVWIGTEREEYFYRSYGWRQIEPSPARMRPATVFDLASLTKPIVTATCLMQLAEEKEISIDGRIKRYLPDFKSGAAGRATIRMLLTHTAGLPAWRPLYLVPPRARLARLAGAVTGRRSVRYSCLGYIILGKLVERVTGMGLDAFFKNTVRNLPLASTGFRPGRTAAGIAATELSDAYEKNKAAAYGDVTRVPWRRYLIRGEAHDGNCFYAGRGVSGNAGLFSNVPDLVAWIRAYLSAGIVNGTSVRKMTTDQTGGREPWGLGWKIDLYPGLLSHRSFGHTGFTGTMLTVDPASGLIVIMLANSVHPRVRLGIMPGMRKEAVRLATRALRSKLK